MKKLIVLSILLMAGVAWGHEGKPNETVSFFWRAWVVFAFFWTWFLMWSFRKK